MDLTLILVVWDLIYLIHSLEEEEALLEERMDQFQEMTLNILLNLTFEEAVFGVEKEISITRSENCDVCHGTGAEPGTSSKNMSTL